MPSKASQKRSPPGCLVSPRSSSCKGMHSHFRVSCTVRPDLYGMVVFQPYRPNTTIGYLEQSLSDVIVKALTDLDKHRSSLAHPAMSIPNSAKAFVALYLKANNGSSTAALRQRATERLQQFLDECALSEKIGLTAARGSAVSAARKSPRLPEAAILGEQFDKLRSEPRQVTLRRYLRPDPVASNAK